MSSLKLPDNSLFMQLWQGMRPFLLQVSWGTWGGSSWRHTWNQFGKENTGFWLALGSPHASFSPLPTLRSKPCTLHLAAHAKWTCDLLSPRLLPRTPLLLVAPCLHSQLRAVTCQVLQQGLLSLCSPWSQLCAERLRLCAKQSARVLTSWGFPFTGRRQGTLKLANERPDLHHR
jgi:hypothetical protein